MFICSIRSEIPRPQDCGRKTHGKYQGECHPRMETSHESARALLIPWISELLPTLYQGLLSQGGTLNRFVKEESNVALVLRVPRCIRAVKESTFQETCPHSSKPLQTLWSPNGCLKFCHKWCLHVRRPLHSVRESKAKWYRTPLHGAREKDDYNYTFLTSVATLLARLSLSYHDG